MARHLVLGCLLLMCSAPIAAQQPTTCSYSECGLLRVDGDILAGQQRAEAASFGHLSPPDLRTLFQTSELALYHLSIADANYRSGKVLGWIGFALVLGSGFAYELIDETGSSPSTGAWVALGVGLSGAGLSFWGDRRVKRATRAVDEGIWWYNGRLLGSP